jgi:hypothetical protein
MTKEKLQAFAEAVSRSEELQKRLASIQVENAKLTAEKMAKLSESTGTPFTAEEYLNLVAESSEEMSADQLQGVAGGAWDASFDNIAMSILFLGVGCALKAAASALGPGGSADYCQFGRNSPG